MLGKKICKFFYLLSKGIGKFSCFVWCEIDKLAHFATVTLAVVGVYGYFYTVKPVFRLERLEEKAAQQEIELKKQEDSKVQLENRTRALSSEIDQLQAEYLEKEKEVYNLDTSLKKMTEMSATLKRDKQRLARDVRIQKTRLTETLFEDFMSSASQECFPFKVNRVLSMILSTNPFNPSYVLPEIDNVKANIPSCLHNALKRYSNFSKFNIEDINRLRLLFNGFDSEGFQKIISEGLNNFESEYSILKTQLINLDNVDDKVDFKKMTPENREKYFSNRRNQREQLLNQARKLEETFSQSIHRYYNEEIDKISLHFLRSGNQTNQY